MTPKDLTTCAPAPARSRRRRRALLVPAGAIALAIAVAGCDTGMSLDAGQSMPVTCKGSHLVVTQVGQTSARLECAPMVMTPYDTAVAAIPGVAVSARLDEGSGTVAANEIPNGPAGTISSTGVTYGAKDTVATAADGQGALKIGATGSVSFPSTSAFNLSTTASSSWTAMLDVRVDVTSGYATILSKGNRATNGFELFADPANSVVGLIVDGKQYAWDGMSLTSMHHLAVSWNGTTLTFFLDGKSVGAGAATAATVTDSGPLVVGKGGGVTVAKLVIAASAAPGLPASTYASLTGGVPPTTTAPAPPTTTKPAPPTTAPSSPTNGAKVIWSDEFNGAAGTGVDSTTWEQEDGAPTNSGRVEYDTPGTHNTAMDGKGDLVISARRESYGGRDYTTGRIESYKSFTTGYLEFRAKLSTWSGTIPALWTYGAAGYGDATGYSELDPVEVRTRADEDPSFVRQTEHGVMPDGSIWQNGWDNNRVDFSPGRPGDAWHTYGVYVNPSDDSVTFYADGKVTAHYAKGSQPSGGNWPYGTYAQKVIVEIEMGSFSGTPTTDRDSDQMLVDYVRVYDKPPA